MKKLKIGLGLVISAALLYFALRGLDWSRFREVFLGFPASLLVLVVAVNLAAAFVRAWRWKTLLKAVGEVRFSHCFHFTNIGYFMNSVLPGRIGELLRPVLLARKSGKSTIAVLTTVLVERLFDFVAVLGLLLTASLVADLPIWMKRGGSTIIAGALLAMGLLFVLSRDFKRAERLMTVASLGRQRIRDFLEPKMRNFFTALGVLRSSRDVLTILGQTLLLWTFYVLTARIILSTLELGGRDWPAAVIVLLFLSLSMLIPASPGYLGTYQLAAIASLGLFGIPKTEAVATSFIMQFPMLFMNIGLGLISLWWEGLGLSIFRKTQRASLRIAADEANPACVERGYSGCEAPGKLRR